MTTAPVAPYIELRFNPTELGPQDLPRAGAYLGTPKEAIQAALSVGRAQMVITMKSEMAGIAEPSNAQLLRIADLAWQGIFWKYRKISAPVIADAYLRAFHSVNAGDVPLSVIYDLADKHAEQIGGYFHSSSRQALSEGFNTLVNRQVPAKAAVGQILDSYGLTSRQTRGLTSSRFQTPISNVLPRSLKARMRAYIDKSFTTRIAKFSEQEEHNIDQQAKQFAWMWQQDKGKLPKQAQKMWITANDEKVCPVCGPLHGKKVGLNERFKTAQGEFWTPGLHPNCRCVVRLIENRFSVVKALTALDDPWDPSEHPRGGDPENAGRFSTRTRTITAPGISYRPEPITLPKPMKLGAITMKPITLEMPTAVEAAPEIAPPESKLGSISLNPITLNRVSLSINAQVAPQVRAEPAAEIRREIQLSAPAPTRTPAPTALVRAHIKTKYIANAKGRTYPVYKVVHVDRNPQFAGNRIDLKEELFHPASDRELDKRVDQLYGLHIMAETQDVMTSGRNRIKVIDPDGIRRTIELTEDQVKNVAIWDAYRGGVTGGYSKESDPIEEFPIAGSEDTDSGYRFSWERGRGEEELPSEDGETVPVNYSMLASKLELTPIQLKVLQLTEGHASREINTIPTMGPPSDQEETWETSGTYQLIKRERRSNQLGRANFDVYKMVPIASRIIEPTREQEF